MMYRPLVVGAAVGALVGAGSRAALARYYLADGSQGTTALVLVAALIGMVVGALAGATQAPIPGAVVGAGLSLLSLALTFPVVAVFGVLGALQIPSPVAVLGAGALAGGAGGAVGRRVARIRHNEELSVTAPGRSA